jgi:succinylarginine dihydrolase
MREFNFDGLVGPTHNYAGLSTGNVASMAHGGQVSNPRAAALQGLAKMKFVAGLGVGQAVLPPHPRPHLATLRRLGFAGVEGADEDILRLTSSASAMWTANAATVAASSDTADGRLHLTPANLRSMFHRAIEAETTTSVLRAIFSDGSDGKRFVVHDPLPGGLQFSDEGAANHTRLAAPGRPAVHVFAWGRREWGRAPRPRHFPARQTLEASQAIARLHGVTQAVFAQQHPRGIDGGAFHTDVLAVGNGALLLLHELAFADRRGLLDEVGRALGDGFRYLVASEDELPVADAVSGYPFNSQLLSLPDGKMAIVAPKDSEENPRCKAFLDRVLADENPVAAVHYLDVRQSMHNGGGPACLRLRVPLTDDEVGAIGANVLYSDALHASLEAWIGKHYRDKLAPADLADPALATESMTALDELTQIMRLGNVYEFQK